jgi:hypothetical protein
LQHNTSISLTNACCLQMVGTHGSAVEVHRVDWKQPQPAGAHRHYLTQKATEVAAVPLHTGKKVIGWAWALAFKREIIQKKSELTMKFSGRHSSVAQSSQASLGAGGDTAETSADVAVAPAAGKQGSHTVVTISGGSSSDSAAPGVTVPQPSKQQQQPLLASMDSMVAAEAENEYTINPRLTLVFKEVWVSDRGVDRDGFGHWVVDQMQSCITCGGSKCTSPKNASNSGRGMANGKGQPDDKSKSGSGSGDGKSTRKSFKARLALQEELAELDEQLDAAAAAGAKFIIPGALVSCNASPLLQQQQQQLCHFSG